MGWRIISEACLIQLGQQLGFIKTIYETTSVESAPSLVFHDDLTYKGNNSRGEISTRGLGHILSGRYTFFRNKSGL